VWSAVSKRHRRDQDVALLVLDMTTQLIPHLQAAAQGPDRCSETLTNCRKTLVNTFGVYWTKRGELYNAATRCAIVHCITDIILVCSVCCLHCSLHHPLYTGLFRLLSTLFTASWTLYWSVRSVVYIVHCITHFILVYSACCLHCSLHHGLYTGLFRLLSTLFTASPTLYWSVPSVVYMLNCYCMFVVVVMMAVGADV